jgi:hypothetical protein
VAGGGVETAKQLRESHAPAAAPSAKAAAPRSQGAATSPPVAWALATQRLETRAKAAPTRKATKMQSQSHGQSVGNHGKVNGHGQGAKQKADAAASLPTTSHGNGSAVGRTSQHTRGQAKRKQGARAAARRTATSEQHGRSAVSHGKAKAKGHADAPAKVEQSAPAPTKPAETPPGKPADGNQSGANGGGSGNGKKSAAAEMDVSLAGVSVATSVLAPGP